MRRGHQPAQRLSEALRDLVLALHVAVAALRAVRQPSEHLGVVVPAETEGGHASNPLKGLKGTLFLSYSELFHRHFQAITLRSMP